jgi:PKD repeat protein
MSPFKRPFGLLGAITLVALLLPFSAAPVAAGSGATVPPGFRDEAMFTGLDHPMAVVFAPDGSVFVAEKRGTVLHYSSLADPSPTVFADLTTNVHNYWDRGLLGLAVDPGYSTGRPYVYVLYTYNHILGDPAPAPRWPSADSDTPPGSPTDDRCPSPPRPTTDGCVVSGRLSRLTSVGGVMSGPEDVLIEDWCQQFPSHSVGSLVFGPEGALYVSAGEGANFNAADYGQFGGTVAGTPTPANPCGDPPTPAGSTLTPPSAEGGALRSQDMRTPGDPVGLDGTIIRVDPDTGLAWPTNANIGASDPNARRIIADGLRNPFRFTIRPGSTAASPDVWLGDVGYATWEEIDRIPDANAPMRDFGWPCWEGNSPLPVFQNLGLSICANLSAGEVTTPYYTYRHSDPVVAGDGCSTGSSSISGMTFLSSTSGYPDAYDGALFFTDYTRRCIWVMPVGANGLPDMSARARFAQLARPDGSTDGGAVFLTTGPNGDLVYADYDRGEIRRVHFYGSTPPVARFTATPSIGAAPLHVDFDASASSDSLGEPLTYAWDLDGDGQYDDAVGVTASWTYDAIADVTARLKVTNLDALSDTETKTISAGNSAPTVKIDTPDPSLTWQVGDSISFSASATDQQDGVLPPSAYKWSLIMRHCPSDCHSHLIETFDGVTSGTFEAPDHEVPSHLQLSVVVTDANGSTGTDSIDLYPQTGTVSVTTAPVAVAMVDGASEGVSPVATGIVGSTVTITAPATTMIDEGLWSFVGWSDGGAQTHAVPIIAGDQHLTATYAFTKSTDRPATCAAAGTAEAPTGVLQRGMFGTPNDIDWYRFKLTKTTMVRIVLGDLTSQGRLELYQGCSKLLQASDRAATGSEEIIRSLPAGTYGVRLVGSATPETADHSLLIKSLPASVHALTYKASLEGSTLRLVGEVYNDTSTKRGQVTVTARLYDVQGRLLTTRSTKLLLPYLSTHTRAPFTIVGSKPAGYHHFTLSVTAPTTSRRAVAPTATITTITRDAAGRLVVTGTVKNSRGYTVRDLAVAITAFDNRRTAIEGVRAIVAATSLGAGRSTTFKATLPTVGLAPDMVYARGVVIH